MATVFEGPWVRNQQGAFAAPPGSRALIDLSPLPAQGSRGLFVSDANLGFDYKIVTDPAAEVWAALTAGADPDGLAGAKPLVPTTKGNLELFLGALARRERFRWGSDPHTNRLRDVLRSNFAGLWERGHERVARKYLDDCCKKYGHGEWREFVPQKLLAHVPGRLPRETTITENFTRTDSANQIGNLLTWTQVGGLFGTSSNRGYKSSGAANQQLVRADSDLSSDDHYAQIACYYPGAGTYHGPCARCPSSATETFYTVVTASDDAIGYTLKLVAGVQTNLGTAAAGTRSDGNVAHVEADGSTVTGTYNGGTIWTGTDTAITGNVRCGVNQFATSGAGTFDDFEAADLGGGGGGNRRRRAIITGGV